MNTDHDKPQLHTPTGLVSQFNDTAAIGWIAANPSHFPLHVELCLNDTMVSSTWANNPSDLTSSGELKGFFIGLRDIWNYAQAGDNISVRAHGTILPICGHGTFCLVKADGPSNMDELIEKFDEGYVFDRAGRLRLSKKLDTDWQTRVVALYDAIRDFIKHKYDYDVFLFYGSLLGQVRESGFIGHDDDFDAAYVSRHTNGPSAAAELRDIGFALIEAGFYVDRKFSALHIHDPHDHDIRIDVFHTYFNADGNLSLPFGRAGSSEFPRADWKGVTEGYISGHQVLIPIEAENVVAHLYGESWETPQVGFSWKQARTKRDPTGFLSHQDRQTLYWANFYAHTEFTSGSTFFGKLSERTDLPTTVVDIGCGDGRDSFAFAQLGRQVLGIDQSHVGVEQAKKKAASTGLSERLLFLDCDVANVDMLGSVLAEARQRANGGPLLFYMRFFLHSISEEVQQTLMSELARLARRGDYIAAEFRTDRDKKRDKTYRKHYRRYQNGPAFGRALRDRYGFTVLEVEQGTGLSIYKNEDPYLYRVIARKGFTPQMILNRIARSARRRAAKVKRRLDNGAKLRF